MSFHHFYLFLYSFILYTSEHQSQNEGGRIVKFVDDSVIVSLVNEQDTDHSPVGNYFFFVTGVIAHP